MFDLKNLAFIVVFQILTASLASAAPLFALGTSNPGPNADTSLYSVDSNTGTATLIGATGFQGLQGLAVDPLTGNIYTTGGSRGGPTVGLYQLNRNTGAATFIGGTGKFIALDFSQDGTLYAHGSTDSSTGDDLYTINTATGVHTFYGSLGHYHREGIAFSGDESEIFLARGSSVLSSLHPVTSAETLIASVSGGDIMRIATAPDGTLFGTEVARTTRGRLYTVNTSTAALTIVGDIGVGIQGLAFDEAAVVPEPTSFALLVTGAFGFMGYGWRRKRRQAA